MRRLQLNTVAYEILVRIFDAVVGTGETLLNSPRTWKQVIQNMNKPSPSQRISLELHRLKKRGLLKQSQQGKKSYLSLTPLGRIALSRSRFARLVSKKSWDGQWFVITFDIPELARSDRDFLRKQLKWMGFHELHKSVWVFPFDVRQELKEFLQLSKNEHGRGIRFLTVSAIDADEDLREHFRFK